jgi:hypothetical protein
MQETTGAYLIIGVLKEKTMFFLSKKAEDLLFIKIERETT